MAKSRSYLDEIEEESEEQKEEEHYPCLPFDESNSLTLALFDYPPCLSKVDECYVDEYNDPLDCFAISLFDELDGCYAYGNNALVNAIHEKKI